MNKRNMVIGLVLLALAFGAIWLTVKPVAAPRSMLKLAGSDGLPFKATIKADGAEVAFSGTLPTEVSVTGRSIDCSFQKMQQDGRISLDVTNSDGASGAVGTSDARGGVRAVLVRKPFLSKFITTTF